MYYAPRPTVANKSKPEHRLCFKTIDLDNPGSLTTYLSVDGYKAIKCILKDKIHPEKVIEIIKESGLRGRGDAGFSTGLKWSFMPKNSEVDGKVFGYSMSYKQEEGKVILDRTFYLDYLLMQPEDFANWNDAIDKFTKDNKQIVILKKK